MAVAQTNEGILLAAQLSPEGKKRVDIYLAYLNKILEQITGVRQNIENERAETNKLNADVQKEIQTHVNSARLKFDTLRKERGEMARVFDAIKKEAAVLSTETGKKSNDPNIQKLSADIKNTGAKIKNLLTVMEKQEQAGLAFDKRLEQFLQEIIALEKNELKQVQEEIGLISEEVKELDNVRVKISEVSNKAKVGGVITVNELLLIKTEVAKLRGLVKKKDAVNTRTFQATTRAKQMDERLIQAINTSMKMRNSKFKRFQEIKNLLIKQRNELQQELAQEQQIVNKRNKIAAGVKTKVDSKQISKLTSEEKEEVVRLRKVPPALWGAQEKLLMADLKNKGLIK
ncbi:MAG: hypothetical protein Q8O89_03795 [Nanoarchaeota archaeon]|nr:hypothetical protein [Nanoarchaeota archaeon]